MITESTIQFRSRPSVQEVLATDKNPAPDCLRIESPATSLGDADISMDRYYSKAWHDREVDRVWRKTWQMACRLEEIPNVGDHVVYEIVHDSLIVVRVSATQIRAYVNSCLHRGTQLRTEDGHVRHFKCPVHGFTWGLDGALKRDRHLARGLNVLRGELTHPAVAEALGKPASDPFGAWDH